MQRGNLTHRYHSQWKSVPDVPQVSVVPGSTALPQREELRDDLGLWEVVGEAIGGADGGVVGAVGLAQFVGHGEGIIEVGERTVGVERPRVQDGLRRGGDARCSGIPNSPFSFYAIY